MRLKRILLILMALGAALVVAVYATLSSLSFEDLRDLAQNEAKALTGRDLAIAGPIDLRISLKPEIVLEDVTFANASWGSRPAMVELTRLELQVALLPLLTGDIQVRQLTLFEPDILLESDEAGRGNWEIGAGDGASGAPSLPSFDLVEIQGGTLTYRDAGAAAPLDLDLIRLRTQAEGTSERRRLELEGRYEGAPVSLAGNVGALGALLAGSFPLELAGTAGSAAIALAGTLDRSASGQDLDLKVAVKGDSLQDLSPFLGRDLPALGPYDLSARLALANDRLEVAGLSVALGESDLAGAFTVSLAGPRPLVEGAFSANLLDLADFRADAPEDQGESGEFLFTEAPIELGTLGRLDARVALKASRLRFEPRLELGELDVNLVLNAGQLSLAPLSAALVGGRLRGEAALDGAGATPQVAAKIQVDDLDYGDLVTRYQVTDKLTGTLDLNLDLRGRGASPRAIASSLNGSSEVISHGGHIDGAVLKVFGAGLGDILGPLFEGGGRADLNCLVSRFQIVDGLATSRALILDSEVLTVAGDGTVDLKTEGLDLRLRSSTRKPGLVSLAVPVHVTGTLVQPRFLPDPVATAGEIAKSAPSFLDTTMAELTALLGGSKDTAEDHGNACLSALEAARGEDESMIDQAGDAVEDAAKAVGDAAKDVTGKIKNLFGD